MSIKLLHQRVNESDALRSAVHTIALCVAVLSLASCASTGNGKINNVTIDDAQRIIVVGKSSKEDVKAAFGDAEAIPFSSGDEIWVYQAKSGSILKSIPIANRYVSDDGKFKELKIVFGKDNIVKKFQLQDTLQAQQ